MGIDGLPSPWLQQAGLHPGAHCQKPTSSSAGPLTAPDSHPPHLQLLSNFKTEIVFLLLLLRGGAGMAAVLVAVAVMHVFLGDSGEQSGHSYAAPAPLPSRSTAI